MKRTTLILALLIFVSGLAYGQEAYLDKTFGDGGVVTVALDWDEYINPYDVQSLPDGKIIHVGEISDPLEGNGIYVIRHHPDGQIDHSFGDQGRSVYYTGGYSNNTKLYRYPNGRLLVYGDRNDSKIGGLVPLLVRFFANGRIDSTFGDNGMYEPPRSVVGGGCFESIKVDKEGTIYAIGATLLRGSISPIYHPSITRITSLGKNDSSFGDMGVMIVGAGSDKGTVNHAVMYEDNKCIFSVSPHNVSESSLNIFCTYLDGTIDSSFGTNGRIMTNLSDTYEYISRIIVDPDGKILCTAGMRSSQGGDNSVLLRFLANGEFDYTFGEFGVAPIPGEPNRWAFDIALDSNKNIIQWGRNVHYDHIIMYYLPNGQVDSSRGGNGTSQVIQKYNWWISSAATDRYGRFVFVGHAAGRDGIGTAFLCRMHNTGQAPAVSVPKVSSSVFMYPTPSTDNCTVTYTLPASSQCTITLRDESGREVRTFVQDEYRTAGKQDEDIDLRGLASGVYFLSIEHDDKTETAKLIKQ
ncbi:MAG TPA: T9SS type A sorting domain-containing protein [Candidatus Kapabacteria bacterium]